MNNKIKTSLLNTCTEKKHNFNKTCILKKSLLFKSHKFTKNSSSVFNSPKKLFKIKESKNDPELKEEKNKKYFYLLYHLNILLYYQQKIKNQKIVIEVKVNILK